MPFNDYFSTLGLVDDRILKMKRKINCLVCDVTYADNNSNNPNHAIYLGVAQGREKLVDRPVFIHQQSSCITKAKKQNLLDKGGKFKNCIVCGHRINLSQKTFDGEGSIEPNGYLVDTNVWIHMPFPLKYKHEDLAIANCYEEAFGHSNFPPDDILSKRALIIDKYVNRVEKPNIIKKEEKEVLKPITKEDNKINEEAASDFLNLPEENLQKKEEKLIDLSLKGFRERGLDNIWVFFLGPLMFIGLFLKWFFLLPFVFMDEYGDRPWFWPVTIFYFIIMGTIINAIL